MSSLKQLSELILKRHNGGQIGSDRFVTFRQVMLHVLQARDAMINRDLWERMKAEGKEVDPAFLWSLPNNTFPDEILPVYDSIRDVYYVQLPTVPASVMNDMGVYNVRPLKGHTQNNKTEYVRIPNGSWSIMPEWFEGMVVWQHKGGGRLEFPNMSSMQSQTSLICDVIPTSIQGMNENDPLPLPTYMEDEIVRRVLELLGMREFDEVNDK